ncbi:inactive poly [ADP-ribose] polymerase RCD1-like isoform X3 [Miscanthus floridulus]|uniref:inactive poly [ADP-ribose] polymerase RCD1-like isoform X3 n=2 Tax=Miscanthus floridulus TaxID=154761 RepID=UPI00345906FC
MHDQQLAYFIWYSSSPPWVAEKEILTREKLTHEKSAAAAGTSTLLRGWREFRRSGAPARFLCFEDGKWVDVTGEAVPRLRRAFQERRAMADASCGGKAYLFDFLRMVRIDEATGEETGLAWIDHRGGCFFPAPADCGGGRNKRKRDDGAPAAEDEAESSLGVDERSGESPGVGVDAKRRKAWGNAAARLEENDKYYQVVSKLFLSYGMAQRGAAITAVRKIAHGVRTTAFQEQARLLADARGAAAGTAKFAWYGASADDVAAVVERGFARNNATRLGARKHGDGVHLSPPQCPYTRGLLGSSMLLG